MFSKNSFLSCTDSKGSTTLSFLHIFFSFLNLEKRFVLANHILVLGRSSINVNVSLRVSG